jgi:hypothetical protein
VRFQPSCRRIAACQGRRQTNTHMFYLGTTGFCAPEDKEMGSLSCDWDSGPSRIGSREIGSRSRC